MPEVNQEVCKERHEKMDERFDRNKERLDANDINIKKLEERQNKIETLTMQTAEILKNQNTVIESYNKRIVDLESKPAKRWDTLVTSAIQWIVTAVMAAYIIFKTK